MGERFSSIFNVFCSKRSLQIFRSNNFIIESVAVVLSYPLQVTSMQFSVEID